MEFNDFLTDETLETEGVTIPCGKSSSCRIARLGNKNYQDFMKKAMAVYENIPKSKIPDSEVEAAVIEGMARHVLLGWEGFTLNGAPYAYSIENARAILTSNKNFRNWVFQQASDEENYKQKQTEDAVKN